MKLIRPKSLTEMVADEVRARIIDGRIGLGAGLSENSLAAELGISKTPVREALLQLKQERLVQVQPQRATSSTSRSSLIMATCSASRRNT